MYIVLYTANAAIANLFLYCFFGKLATESFQEMADSLSESNWLNLDVALQKYYILMIRNAQIPLEYSGFGIAPLNLITFSKVNWIKFEMKRKKY